MMKVPVLLLDDDLEWLHIIRRRLPQEAYAIDIANFIEQALELIKVVRYPVVVTDLKLQNGDEGGFELLSDENRLLSPFTKLIVISSFGDEQTSQKAEELGVVSYLPKSYEIQFIEQLNSRINLAIQEWTIYIEEMKNVGVISNGAEVEIFEKIRSSGRELPALHEKIKKGFSLTELGELCFSLGIDNDEIPGVTKSEKSMKLLEYLSRRGRVVELIELCQKQRPHLDW